MYKTKLFLFTVLLSGCMGKNGSKLALDWKVAGVLPPSDQPAHIGVAGPTVGLLGDRLFVAGGANFPDGMPWEGGKKVYQKEAYMYQIGADGTLQLDRELAFADSLAYAANVSLDANIYSIGGERNGAATSDVSGYYLEHEVLRREVLPSLPVPLTNAGAVAVDGALYLVGGENSEGVSDKVYRLNLAARAQGWQQFAVLPYPISNAVVVADEQGHILIAGGRKRNLNAKSDIYAKVWQLATLDKSLKELTELPYAVAAGTGVMYDNTLVLVGGDNAATFHQVEELIGAINVCTDDAEKAELTARKNKVLREHPGFGKEVWAMNLKEQVWYRLEDIKGASPVTTTAILYGDRIIIPSGEVKAGVRTDQLLMGSFR